MTASGRGASGERVPAFACGATVPLMPYLFEATRALEGAIGLTALGLFGVGAAMSLFTGRRAIRSGLRMLAIGALAVSVIVHMTRSYWRKALAALCMDLHPDREIAQ